MCKPQGRTVSGAKSGFRVRTPEAGDCHHAATVQNAFATRGILSDQLELAQQPLRPLQRRVWRCLASSEITDQIRALPGVSLYVEPSQVAINVKWAMTPSLRDSAANIPAQCLLIITGRAG